ncbi:hypothetical protein [Novipirellula maiorica]|uniref:hypothetical protein n=1 Tax=Novipirellula maiorica TaxID=1265734 RepID=UPI001F1C9EE4|nr:hypothetical protein [Rhodopirellula maiorica]
MPWQLAASSSRISRVFASNSGSESWSAALTGAVAHFAEAAEQQLHAVAGLDGGVSRLASEISSDLRVRAIKNAGGWTLFSAAHCNFSASLWQQHLSQQYSAVEQPQGQFSQGKRPIFSGRGVEIGNPVIPHANTINSVTLMIRWNIVDRRE